ncbi:hypothetical protein BLA29_014466 [Euroglyphus maynei]
MFNMW